MIKEKKNISTVTFLLLMVLGSHGVLMLLLAFIGFDLLPEGFTAMSAPLWVGVLSIARIDTTYRTTPDKLTALMTKSFFFKMIFYALLIVAVIRFSAFNPIPFISIFTGFFIALLGVEAAFLRRLFKNKT